MPMAQPASLRGFKDSPITIATPTMTIKKTSAVTQSVANTAKRVIVIVGVAIVMGESLNPLKLAGCAIGIGGVFLYSVIDQLLAKK